MSNINDDGKQSIAGQIAYNRIRKGFTQQELADKIGTTKSGISRIESGRQNISYNQLAKIAEGLNMTVGMVMEDLPESYLHFNLHNTEYVLKMYNEPLVYFSMIGGFETEIKIKHVIEERKNVFPIDLKLDSRGMLAWLSERIIPKNREFVGAILQSVGIKEGNLKGIIDVCMGLSLNDSYWVVPENFEGKFEDYNLYTNNFSSVLALVAYTGYPYEDKKFTTSPEFTTGGVLRKAWRFKEDGIWLYKGGTEGFANAGCEPYSEYYASQIAKAMGLSAVEYSLENWKGILASKCKLFSDIDISFIPAWKVVRNNTLKECLEFYKSLGDSYYQDFVSMLVFDAIILNEDRHFGNFGFLRDNKSGQIISTAPIFDNGNSLLSHAMKNDFETEEKFNLYVAGRKPCIGDNFISVAKALAGPKQKKELRKLIGFKFVESDICNLPQWRILRLEEMIQNRIKQII